MNKTVPTSDISMPVIQHGPAHLNSSQSSSTSTQIEDRLISLPSNGNISQDYAQLELSYCTSHANTHPLWDPWGLFFIHLTCESRISYHKGMNSGWMKLG